MKECVFCKRPIPDTSEYPLCEKHNDGYHIALYKLAVNIVKGEV